MTTLNARHAIAVAFYGCSAFLTLAPFGELDELLNDETAIQTALEGLHRGLNDADYKASGFPDDIAAMVLLALKNAPRDRVEKIYLEDYAAAIAAGYARE